MTTPHLVGKCSNSPSETARTFLETEATFGSIAYIRSVGTVLAKAVKKGSHHLFEASECVQKETIEPIDPINSEETFQTGAMRRVTTEPDGSRDM